MELYTRASEGGHLDGICSLGECYASGTGAPRDEGRAAQLYQRAADKGSARGMYLLGQCCEMGRGVERDPAKAQALYQKAADKGHKKAKEALELMPASRAVQRPAPPKPVQKKEKKGWWPFGRK